MKRLLFIGALCASVAFSTDSIDCKKAESLISHLNAQTCDYQETNGDVTVRAKVLKTEQECIDAFGLMGNKLIKRKSSKFFKRKRRKFKKIYPIKLSITNNRKEAIKLAGCDAKLASTKIVSKRIGRKVPLWKSFVLMSGIFLASLGLGIFSVVCFPPFGFIAGGTIGVSCGFGFLGAFFIVPCGTVAAPVAAYFYRSNSQKAETKYLYSSETQPKETKTFFVFVEEKNYKEKFTINFAQNDLQELLPFTVKLPELEL